MGIRRIAALSLIVAIGGCGRPPYEDLPLLSSVDMDESVSRADLMVAAAPPPPRLRSEDRPRRGLLGRLATRAERAKAEPDLPPSLAALRAIEPEPARPSRFRMLRRVLPGRGGRDAPPAIPAAMPASEIAALTSAPAHAEPDSLLPMLAALQAPQADTRLDAVPDLTEEATPDTRGANRVLASLPDDSRAATPRPKRGFFARLTGRGRAKAPQMPFGDPARSEVGPGEAVPEGQLARLCGVPVERFGDPVSLHPATAPRYVLYDSRPGSTEERNWYLTGFEDGCARQITGVMALFGSAEMHEGLRYGETSAAHPYSATDAAYEEVKAQVCKVGRGAPCGPDRAGFDRDTVFLTVYESFGAARWTNILLHDGRVAAVDIAAK